MQRMNEQMLLEMGSKIRNRRKELRLSMKELAEQVSCSEQAISQYERGKRSPSVDMIGAIAKALNCTMSDILPEKELERIQEQTEVLLKVFGDFDDVQEYNARKIEFMKKYDLEGTEARDVFFTISEIYTDHRDVERQIQECVRKLTLEYKEMALLYINFLLQDETHRLSDVELKAYKDYMEQ